MRKLLALASVLLIAGCGTTRPKEPTRAIPGTGHECKPGDEALQCVLPPLPKSLNRSAPLAVARGVDFAWGAPTAAQARSRYGATFGASYLSFDPAKGWAQRAGLVSEYHRAELGTVAVWETAANRASQGCGAGASDARAARQQAAALGNTDGVIDFAIDFDASGPQVAAYFTCAHAILGQRAGAYGGYTPLGYLCAHHLVGSRNWQTYAWSGGRWLPASCAPLEQYLNGSAVDYDRAIARDYGQWPRPGEAASRVVKRRALAAQRALIKTLHGNIERHACRKHATPKSYHRVCGRWLVEGQHAHRFAKRLARELA